MDLKKNSKVTYLLAILVIGIWSVIVIRVFSFDDNMEVSLPKIQPIQSSHRKNKEKEVYCLQENYIDPFLGRKNSKKSAINNISRSRINQSKISETRLEYLKKKEAKRKTAPKENTPKIVYRGLYTNTSRGKKIALVDINEHRYVLNEGKIVQGVKVLFISKDSIQVSCSDDVLMIRKE